MATLKPTKPLVYSSFLLKLWEVGTANNLVSRGPRTQEGGSKYWRYVYRAGPGVGGVGWRGR